MKRRKNEKIAILLAALPGAFGFLGIGHIYAGRIGRGFILLVGAWVLAGIGFLCLVAWSMSHMVIPPPGQPIGEPPAYSLVLLAVGSVLLLGLAVLWIWQIFDAKSVCRNYNKQISK